LLLTNTYRQPHPASGCLAEPTPKINGGKKPSAFIRHFWPLPLNLDVGQPLMATSDPDFFKTNPLQGCDEGLA
jgi:hypothetical protein